MKFTVEITLNHDLMKNATQIKDALHRVGMQLDSLSIKRSGDDRHHRGSGRQCGGRVEANCQGSVR